MKELEKKIYKHLKERGWHNLRPSDLAKSIAIESGELLELFQWENKPLEEVKKNKEKVEKIGRELADVLTYALDLSVLLGLNTEKIINDHLAHVAKKYPAKLIKENSKDEPGTEDIYWKIKSEYRKKGL
jgi:dCTP diphosphatase